MPSERKISSTGTVKRVAATAGSRPPNSSRHREAVLVNSDEASKRLNAFAYGNDFVNWTGDFDTVLEGIKRIRQSRTAALNGMFGPLLLENNPELWHSLLDTMEDPQTLGTPQQIAKWLVFYGLAASINDVGSSTKLPKNLDPRAASLLVRTPEFVKEDLDKKAESFKKKIRSFKVLGAVEFFKFADIYSRIKSNNNRGLESRPNSQVISVSQQDAREFETLTSLATFDSELNELMLYFENQLSSSEINELLNILPTLKNPHVLFQATLSIYKHSGDVSRFSESTLAQTPALAKLVTLRMGIETKQGYDYRMRTDEGLKDVMENPIADDYGNNDDYAVPQKYLPTAAIVYLFTASQNVPKKEFKKAIEELNEYILQTPDGHIQWLLALDLLKAADHPVFADIYSNFIEQTSQITPDMKDVLLDKRPGKLFLTPEGKLRIRDANSNLASAFLIYTSEALPDEPEEGVQIIVAEKEVKTPENQVEAEIIFTYDFLGDVAIAGEENTLKYLNSIKPSVLDDPDDLMLEFFELSDAYDPNQEKTRVFVADLNSGDAAMRKARQIGIDSIVISGPAVTFVLNKDKQYSLSDDKKVPVAFSGVLDEKGQLVLDTEIENADQPHLILLNNIALELASRKIEKPQEDSKEQAEKTITDWNRGKRGTLPRLDRSLKTESEVLIAVKANGQTVFTIQS